jgi:hypothetical protein
MLYDQYAETLRSIKVKGKEIEWQHIISAVLQFSNKLYNEFIDFRKYVES